MAAKVAPRPAARKHVLDIDCRTGGIFRRNNLVQQTVADRSYHRTGFHQQVGPLCQQLRGRGFTVGTGDANQAHCPEG